MKRLLVLALLGIPLGAQAGIRIYKASGGGSGTVTVGNAVTGGGVNNVLFNDSSGNLGSAAWLRYQAASSTQTLLLGGIGQTATSVFDIEASSSVGGIAGIDIAGGFGNRVIDFWGEPSQVNLEGQIIGMSTTALNGTAVNVGDFVLDAGNTLPNQPNSLRLFAGNQDVVDVGTGTVLMNQNTTVTGTMKATLFSGSGASLTAATIPTAALAAGALPSNVTVSTTNMTWSNTPVTGDLVTVGSNGQLTDSAPTTQVPGPGGWVSSTNTWVALSSFQFTSNGNETNNIATGDEVWFTNNSATFYGYVSTVSFGVSLSTVTLDPNSSFTMAAGAITSPKYSHDASRTYVNFAADWVNFTPSTTTGFAGTGSGPPSIQAQYKEVGREIIFNLISTSSGTSNAITYLINLPAPAAANLGSGIGGFGVTGTATCEDSGAVQNSSVWNIVASGTTAAFDKSLSSTGWTASGAKACTALMTYPR
jgi:hypothetical protein